jgi:hypothetical protein
LPHYGVVGRSRQIERPLSCAAYRQRDTPPVLCQSHSMRVLVTPNPPCLACSHGPGDGSWMSSCRRAGLAAKRQQPPPCSPARSAGVAPSPTNRCCSPGKGARNVRSASAATSAPATSRVPSPCRRPPPGDQGQAHRPGRQRPDFRRQRPSRRPLLAAGRRRERRYPNVCACGNADRVSPGKTIAANPISGVRFPARLSIAPYWVIAQAVLGPISAAALPDTCEIGETRRTRRCPL